MTTVNLRTSVLDCKSCRNHVHLRKYSEKNERLQNVIDSFHEQMKALHGQPTVELCRDKFQQRAFNAILDVFGKELPVSVYRSQQDVIHIPNPHFRLPDNFPGIPDDVLSHILNYLPRSKIPEIASRGGYAFCQNVKEQYKKSRIVEANLFFQAVAKVSERSIDSTKVTRNLITSKIESLTFKNLEEGEIEIKEIAFSFLMNLLSDELRRLEVEINHDDFLIFKPLLKLSIQIQDRLDPSIQVPKIFGLTINDPVGFSEENEFEAERLEVLKNIESGDLAEGEADRVTREMVNMAKSYFLYSFWMRLVFADQFEEALAFAKLNIPDGCLKLFALVHILSYQGRVDEARNLVMNPPIDYLGDTMPPQQFREIMGDQNFLSFIPTQESLLDTTVKPLWSRFVLNDHFEEAKIIVSAMMPKGFSKMRDIIMILILQGEFDKARSFFNNPPEKYLGSEMSPQTFQEAFPFNLLCHIEDDQTVKEKVKAELNTIPYLN